jgi:alkylation response protein AidB-like acyl-CoA dehydrogenase
MDFELNEEQKALVALAKDFCRREAGPEYVNEILARKEEDRIPWELLKKIHEVGFPLLTLPEKYGGRDVDLLTRVVLADTMGQYGILVGGMLSTNWRYCTDIAVLGTEEQQEMIFNRIINEPYFSMGEGGNEPDHGCDVVFPHDEPGDGMDTFAYRDGDEYVINGEKCFIGMPNTGGEPGGLLWVFARTDKNKPLSQGVSCFLMPTETPGFSVSRVNEWIFTRIRMLADLRFDDVRVPVRNRVGEEGQGMAILQGRFFNHLTRLAMDLGRAQAIYEYTKEYAKTRVQGGKPIFEHLTVGTRIVDMLLNIERTRYLTYKTAWDYDQEIKAGGILLGTLGFNLCNAAIKELGVVMCSHAAEVFGGRSALKELPIEGYIRATWGGQHAYGTGTVNLIKSMRMI